MKLFVISLLQFCNVAGAAHLRQPGRTGIFIESNSSGNDQLRRQSQAVAQRKSATLKLTLANHNGVQYTGRVSIGGQELPSVYDTGSFEVMTISRQCSVCQLHTSLRAYDNGSSQTFRQGTRGIEDHHFAGGTVKAREDYETIQVGGTDSVVKVENMAFWQVLETNMPVFLNGRANFTAVTGLGHRSRRGTPPVGNAPADPDSESLIERTGIEKFSICLLPGLANPGYLTFNPAHNLADPGFRKLSVVGERHWAVKLAHVQTDLFGTPLHACWEYGGQHPCQAVIDSGTSFIGVPPDATVMIKTLIKRIKYDCSNLDELPDLVFELDGNKFALPARAYTVHMGMVNGKPTRCMAAFTDVSMSLQGANVWILGMPFLRHFYTVFDREAPSIYVADQADNCEPALGGNGAFIDASKLGGRLHRQQQPPTIADLSAGSLPFWASGNKDI